MAADDLAPCITRASTAMLLNIKDKQVVVFHEKDFNYLDHLIVKKCQMIFMFQKIIQQDITMKS